MIVRVRDLQAGDIVRWTSEDPWVTVLKRKADSYGYDVLYQHGGNEPRWRGFDVGDTVERRKG